jgi:hypothetical protein
MKPDDFEKRLQSQPLRQIPSEWRKDVLQRATSAPHSSLAIRHSLLSTLNSKLSTLLWPHPKAWAGLAALWIAIAALQFANSDSASAAKKTAPPSADTLVILQQQSRMMAELVGPMAPHEVDRPKPRALPRSERRAETACA